MPDKTIAEIAREPKKASDGSGSVEMHSIQDQILAEKHASKSKARGIKACGFCRMLGRGD